MRSVAKLTSTPESGWRRSSRAGNELELERRAQLLEVSIPGMRGHSRRVAVYAALTAQRLGLDRVAVTRVRRAAALHDIGKTEVPAEVLSSARPLGDEEFAAIQEHAIAGARIVSVLGDQELTAIVRHHHERFDGGGYPAGSAASGSRSAPASSPSPTPSTPSPPSVPTAPPSTTRRRWRCSRARPAPSSTPRSSPPSASTAPVCATS